MRYLVCVLAFLYTFNTSADEASCRQQELDTGPIAKTLFIECKAKELFPGEYQARSFDGKAPNPASEINELLHKFGMISDKLAQLSAEVENPELQKLASNFEQRAREAVTGFRERDSTNDGFKKETWKAQPEIFSNVVFSEFEREPDPIEFVDLSDVVEATCPDELCSEYRPFYRRLAFEVGLAYEMADAISEQRLKNGYEYARLKDNEWEVFLYESKTQFFLDFVAQDWANSDDLDDYGILGPPETQRFFLHPYIAYEYVGKATDGNQLEPALSIEVYGINKWNEKSRFLIINS